MSPSQLLSTLSTRSKAPVHARGLAVVAVVSVVDFVVEPVAAQSRGGLGGAKPISIAVRPPGQDIDRVGFIGVSIAVIIGPIAALDGVRVDACGSVVAVSGSVGLEGGGRTRPDGRGSVVAEAVLVEVGPHRHGVVDGWVAGVAIGEVGRAICIVIGQAQPHAGVRRVEGFVALQAGKLDLTGQTRLAVVIGNTGRLGGK